MGAYLGFSARPVGFADDAASLRALALDQVVAGQAVQLLAAGGLQFWIVRWDPAETAADDGQRYFIPDSIVFPAPGRWVTEASTASLPNTLVLRDGTGLATVSLTAPLTLHLETVAPNTAPDFLTFEHHTSDAGNGAVGIGAGIAFKAETSAGVLSVAAQITASLTLANGNASKIDFSASSGGLYGVRMSLDGVDLKVSGGAVLVGSRVDRLTAAALQLGGTAVQLTCAPSTGQVNWQKGSNLARTDLFDDASACSFAFEPGVTAVSESWNQRAAGAGGAWTRTGQQGFAGSVGGNLAFVTGLGGNPGADLAGSFDVDLGAVVSQATAQLRLRSAGATFGRVRAISGQLLSVEAVAASASAGGMSFSTPALLQFLLADDQKVTHQWGTGQFTEWRRKVVTTVNATPVSGASTFSFTIPSSASGSVLLLVTSVDVTNGDRATYRREYSFSRRNAAASLFTAVGGDTEYEVDAAWNARVTHASPTFTVDLVGDAANQTQHDVQWWVHYQTFAPV